MNHVPIEGIHGLTLRQAKALAAAASSTLERDSWADRGSRSLTPSQTKSCQQALEKLLTAIQWHEETTNGDDQALLR